jgi:trigger factor
MTVECNEFEYCKVKVNYIADPDLVEEKRDEVVANIKRAKVKLRGFRAGKATDLAIRTQLKKKINEMLRRELVSEAYEETLFETKMKPIFYPEIHESHLDGNNFSCNMTFLKKPDFELKQYKGFEIPKPHRPMTAAEGAEKMIQELRVQHADPVPYGENDFVQDGDQVTLDVIASDPNGKLDGLSREGALYTVGQNPIKEIDQKMYGMKAGEEREFDIIFEDSEDYQEQVRGKRIKFNVKVHMGTKKVPLPLDDELAKKVGLETYEKLRNEAEGTASARIDANEKQQIMNQVMMQILAAHDFEVPAWNVLMESQKFAAGQGVPWESLTDEQVDNINAQSRDKVKLSLILDAIRDDEPDAVYSDQEMIDKIRAQITEQGQNADEIMSRLAQDGSLIGTIAAMKDKAIMHWLVEQSTVIEE